MMQQATRPKWIGRLIGLVLFLAAVAAVFLLKWKPPPPSEPASVRPVKTMLIESPFSSSARQYPGKVQASRRINLAFQVDGPLIEFPVKNGQDVEQGQLLARLDPADYENEQAAKKAAMDKTETDLEKAKKLRDAGAATFKEVNDAQARFDAAKAKYDIATKAVNDTYMKAPFAGVIADTFVENFQDVRAKESILSLQDVSSVEIVVNVPQQRVIVARAQQGKMSWTATFDDLPDRRFAVAVKEFATDADPATQTYAVTFAMPAPEDVLILPGMTATVSEQRKDVDESGDAGYAVPIDAVPVDGLGVYHVWLLKAGDGGRWTVQRSDVKVGQMIQDRIVIVDGVNKGDRIATAGVHLLEQGQTVRLLDDSAEAAAP